MTLNVNGETAGFTAVVFFFFAMQCKTVVGWNILQCPLIDKKLEKKLHLRELDFKKKKEYF